MSGWREAGSAHRCYGPPMSPIPDPRLFLGLAARAVVCAAHRRTCPEVPPDDPHGGGVFVTLRRRGELVGCVGHPEGDPPLGRAVLAAALAAAARDPRFPPVAPDDLAELEVELSLLSPLVRIHDPAGIRPGVDGLLLAADGCRGLLLPQVATDADLDRDAFLEALREKAGLPGGAWTLPGARLFGFTVRSAASPLAALLEEPA